MPPSGRDGGVVAPVTAGLCAPQPPTPAAPASVVVESAPPPAEVVTAVAPPALPLAPPSWGASFGLGLQQQQPARHPASPAAAASSPLVARQDQQQRRAAAAARPVPASATATSVAATSAQPPVVAVTHVVEVAAAPLNTWFLSDGMPCFDRTANTSAAAAAAAHDALFFPPGAPSSSTSAATPGGAARRSLGGGSGLAAAALGRGVGGGPAGTQQHMIAAVQASLAGEADASDDFTAMLAEALIGGMSKRPAWAVAPADAVGSGASAT